MYWYQLYAWYAAVAAEALLLIVLLRFKRWHYFPWFFTWIAVDFAATIPLLIKQAANAPYRDIWIGTAPSLMVLFTAAGIESVAHAKAMWPFKLATLTLIGALGAYFWQPLPRVWPQFFLEPLFFARAFSSAIVVSAIVLSLWHQRLSRHAKILGAVALVNATMYLFPNGWPSCIFLTGGTLGFLAWAHCFSRPVLVFSDRSRP